MQFDVFKNPNPATQAQFPFLLDVQVDLLSDLETRVVIPLSLARMAEDRTLSRLMPKLKIRGKQYVAITNELAGVPRRALGECVENLADSRGEIVSALDFLFTGI